MWVTGLGSVEDVYDQIVIVVMEPIRKHDRADIDIVIIVARRTVNDDGPGETIDVLSAVVAMPPRCPVQLSAEAVGKGLARSDGAIWNVNVQKLALYCSFQLTIERHLAYRPYMGYQSEESHAYNDGLEQLLRSGDHGTLYVLTNGWRCPPGTRQSNHWLRRPQSNRPSWPQ